MENSAQKQRAQIIADAVLKYYHNRCLICWGPAVAVHEIVPKSRSNTWNRFENRVPVCNSCHNILQSMPAREQHIKMLEAKARAVLILGGEPAKIQKEAEDLISLIPDMESENETIRPENPKEKARRGRHHPAVVSEEVQPTPGETL
jgi:hypothetical protein